MILNENQIDNVGIDIPSLRHIATHTFGNAIVYLTDGTQHNIRFNMMCIKRPNIGNLYIDYQGSSYRYTDSCKNVIKNILFDNIETNKDNIIIEIINKKEK